MAAPAFQSDGGEVFANANNNTAVTIPLPGTRPNGSVLLLIAWCRLITATITTPSGYTLLSTFTSGTASGGRIWVYGRIVDGSETAPTLVTTGATGTSGDLAGAAIFCYSDVDTSGGISSIFDGTPTTTDAAGTTTCTYPALTTSLTDSTVVRFLARFRDAVDTFTPTATWNEREDAGSTNRTGGQFHLQDKAPGASGSQASVTVAPSNTTSARYLAVTLALKPLVPKQTGVAQISLAAGSDPATRTAHAIKVRARVTAGPGASTIRAALYEGGTNRSGDLESSGLTTSLADYTLSIPDASAANITDYSNLEIRIWGYNADATVRTFEVDQIWLEIPAAASTPKSGTDSNGTTTENAARSAAISGTDSGSGTETATDRYLASSTDNNGTTTESATYQFLRSGTDANGVTTELAARSAVIAATADAGAGSEASALTAQIPSSDASGAGAQSAAFTYLAASSDSGSGSESATVTVPIAASDNGSGSEAATMLYLASGSDSGTATAEDVYFVKRQGFIDNTGIGTDTSTLAASIPSADSGSGSESGSVFVGGASVSGTDSGNGFDRVGAVAAVIDNFNRANSGSLGAGWTPLTTDGGLTIAGNEVASTAAAHLGNYRNDQIYSDDQYAEIEVTSTPLAAGDFIGVMARAKNGGRDFYTVFYGALVSDGGVGHENLYLYKRVNDGFAGAGGGFLSFGQTKVEIGTLSPGDKIRIEAIGPNIRAYVNGVLILQGVDFDHLSGGAPGVFAYGFSHLDNFKGGDLSPVSAPAIVSDNFNRADGANFGGSAQWVKANIAPSVASNRIAGQGSTTVGGAFVGIFGDTQASQITGMTIPGGAWVGVSVRDMAPTQQQYLAIAYNAGPPIVSLYKQNGYGNYTQLGSSYTIPGGTISGSDILRIEAVGSTITAKYNGVTAVSVTDTFIPGGGAPGLAIWDAASADDWQGEHSRVLIPALIATIPATDNNGATTEASTLAVAVAGSDSNGATTESGSTAIGTVFKTDSDNGAGSETAARSAVLTGTDTGAGSETAVPQAVLTGADSNATWVESALSSAFKADNDSATSVESATYRYSLSSTDSGVGADALSSIGVSGSDASNAGTDAGSRQGFYAVTDAGSGSDSSALVAAVTGADSGSGTDSGGVLGGQVFMTGLDTGTGIEVVTAFAKATIDAGIGADLVTQMAKVSIDAGSSSENAARSALIAALDSGNGTDIVSAFARALSDAGSGTDIVSLLARTVTDAGVGSDSSQLTQLLFVTDQNVSADNAVLRAFLIDVDTGASDDIATLGDLHAGHDFGFGADNALAFEHIERFVQELLSAVGQKPTLVSAGEKNGHVMTTTAQKPRLTSAEEESGRIVTTTIEKPKLLSGR